MKHVTRAWLFVVIFSLLMAHPGCRMKSALVGTYRLQPTMGMQMNAMSNEMHQSMQNGPFGNSRPMAPTNSAEAVASQFQIVISADGTFEFTGPNVHEKGTCRQSGNKLMIKSDGSLNKHYLEIDETAHTLSGMSFGGRAVFKKVD